MPGFQIGGQGEGPSNTVETRRKHRWVWTVLGTLTDTQIMLLLKSAQRPKVILEEPVLHHNQEQVYFAGKQSWDPIELTFYDAENSPDSSKGLWDWYNKAIDVPSANVEIPSKYKKESTLQMKNGKGETKETWKIFGCWPKEVNWEALAYEDTEIATIVVSMRFDRAIRE